LTLYLDSSLLVAALTIESKTSQVQDWLTAQSAEQLVISDWVVTEFSAALSIKLRTAQIPATHRTTALAAFGKLSIQSLAVLPVSSRHFHTAAQFAEQYALGLRAGDALHLAICADHHATICTLDRRQSEAGSALGLGTLLL
jgi:predicted nucleic acid-binding protein